METFEKDITNYLNKSEFNYFEDCTASLSV
jgi:hypothetical protein